MTVNIILLTSDLKKFATVVKVFVIQMTQKLSGPIPNLFSEIAPTLSFSPVGGNLILPPFSTFLHKTQFFFKMLLQKITFPGNVL